MVPERGICAECGFVVGRESPYLLEVLLSVQTMEGKQEILTEYGTVSRQQKWHRLRD